ncbi:MAG: sigma-70 family RNA polymerase sigma factor [Candidatus Pacebacteria bacterium]|nr:sigma-70 family RNA polymerase sigma factor [Candidatus Paceibacterota bacterium]
MPHKPNDTKQLLAQAQTGDMDAFAALFEQYRPLLYRLAYRLVGANDCEDVVMDTYLKVWRAIPEFRGKASLKTWLCRVLRNCAYDYLRQRARAQARTVSVTHRGDGDEEVAAVEHIPDTDRRPPDREAIGHETEQIVREAIQQLPEHHRVTMLMRDVDGLSYKQVATSTGVSIGTVMSRLYHARRKLRRILEKSLGDTPV